MNRIQPSAPRPKSRRTLWITLGTIGGVLALSCAGLVVLGLVVGPQKTNATNAAAPTSKAPARPLVSAATPAPSTHAASPTPPTKYGFLQTVAWWNRTFPVVPAGQCTAAGETSPVGTQHAWQLPNGGLACVDESPNAWSDHITGVDIFFANPVAEQQAVSVAAGLLPSDAARAGTFDGVNPGYSTKPKGSCRQVVFTSAEIRTVVRSLNPSWTADPSKATVGLYSGNATSDNGADKAYDQRRVHLAMVTIAGENRATDGVVHC